MRPAKLGGSVYSGLLPEGGHMATQHTVWDGQLSDTELGAWRGLLRLHSELIRELDSELIAIHQLPLRSYEVLVHLADAPERQLRMSDLSRSVLLSASGVSRLVDRMEAEGLVCRRRCELDGRGFFAVLTDAGEAKLRAARPTHLAGIRRLFLDHFDTRELREMAALWERALPGASEA
jgi:DNA-binding MarR family transcriptional regulator